MQHLYTCNTEQLSQLYWMTPDSFPVRTNRVNWTVIKFFTTNPCYTASSLYKYHIKFICGEKIENFSRVTSVEGIFNERKLHVELHTTQYYRKSNSCVFRLMYVVLYATDHKKGTHDSQKCDTLFILFFTCMKFHLLCNSFCTLNINKTHCDKRNKLQS